MIGWAAPMLGSEDPALAEAQSLLDDGKFLQSLYAVREALRAFPERLYSFNDSSSVETNAWVTGMRADPQAGSLAFQTHASPTSEIHLSLRLPLAQYGENPTITADGAPVTATMSTDGGIWVVEFTLPGGPHAIQVVSH